MDMYDIDQETVTSILTAADEIVELMDRDTGLIYKAKDRNQKTKFSYQEIN